MTDFKEQFETTKKGLLVRAPAKINLSLLIAGKRPDGFHEIETIMAKINYCDELLIQTGQKPGIELICKGTYQVPQGKGNLVYRACESFMKACGKNHDIRITLTKNIPPGSGLGSASSDAAATLMALNKFLKFPLSTSKLFELAPGLGSDVAFFLNGPLALCLGKGEKIKKINKNFNFLAILILPDVNVSTKRIYENYQHNSALYKSLRDKINGHIQKNRFDLAYKMCANMLEKYSFDIYNKLGELKNRLESLVVRPVCLSGSGAGMFYIVEGRNKNKALKLKQKVEERVGCKIIIVSNNRW